MTISKMCKECIGVVIGHCAGKESGTIAPGQKPCKDYTFDMSMASESDIEPDSPPPSLKDRKPSKPKDLVPDAVLVMNKAKADRFKRLATQRLTKTLDDVRKLGNLSTRGNYEWDSEQIESIIGRLHGAVDDLGKKFRK